MYNCTACKKKFPCFKESTKMKIKLLKEMCYNIMNKHMFNSVEQKTSTFFFFFVLSYLFKKI